MKKYLRWLIVPVLACASFAAWGQDVSVPFSWEGKGEAFAMIDGEVQNIHFTLRFKVDSDGIAKGDASAGDDRASLKKIFYGESGEKGREVILIFTTSDSILAMKGKSLKDSFVFGELLIAPRSSSLENALDLDNGQCEPIYDTYQPQGLKTFLKEAQPLGCFSVEGSFES